MLSESQMLMATWPGVIPVEMEKGEVVRAFHQMLTE